MMQREAKKMRVVAQNPPAEAGVMEVDGNPSASVQIRGYRPAEETTITATAW
jgi:hypothetical protein